MAHMIPAVPKDFAPSSHEGIVFDALKKLPDNYWVFHSVSAIGVRKNNILYEKEIDFVIADQNRGFVCLEVKAGSNITYMKGNWYYSNGQKMGHRGPYHQAKMESVTLQNKFEEHSDYYVQQIGRKCKFLSSVCFPDMSITRLRNLDNYPTDFTLELTLCAEDLIDPEKKINDIFSVRIEAMEKSGIENNISIKEFDYIINKVLCPAFQLIPSPNAAKLASAEYMNQLLHEQYVILEFLEEQNSAVINGAAGTGKTMLAVEKARRHSVNGEKVLFLCYNRLLRDKLVADYKKNAKSELSDQYQNVEFYTISGLAHKITGRPDDYNCLLNYLCDCIDKKQEFGFQHIIVDEGQDFGIVDAENNSESASVSDNISIIDYLQEAALANNGTFYLFYDKYQMIQGNDSIKYELPDCITNSDCRLTLHKNCRNTVEIAKTSTTPLRNHKGKNIHLLAATPWDKALKPNLYIVDTLDKVKDNLNKILDNYKQLKIEDIVILTQNKLNYTAISDVLKHKDGDNGYEYYYYNGKEYKVTTCKKFKGLEAEAVVFLDLGKDSFSGQKGLEFYVGSSRAKYYLDLICVLSDSQLSEVVTSIDAKAPVKNRNAKVIKSFLGQVLKVNVIS